MVFVTVDLVYIIGMVLVVGSLFIPWQHAFLLFTWLAVAHIVAGVLYMFRILPELPTLTNNNYLLLTHGTLDVTLVVIAIVMYALILSRSVWWEIEN